MPRSVITAVCWFVFMIGLDKRHLISFNQTFFERLAQSSVKPYMNTQQLKAIRAIADAIIDSVKAAGNFGAPSGVVYAALMGVMNLDQYQQFISGLVRAGKLRTEGDLLFAVESEVQ